MLLALPAKYDASDNVTCKDLKKLQWLGYDVDLGFAMTFHKCQGKTLDAVVMDLNDQPGTRYRLPKLELEQLYVGMTRVRHYTDIRILPPTSPMGFRHLWSKATPTRFTELHSWMRKQ